MEITNYDVLLTVNLSIFISVFNQFDAQNLFHSRFYFMPLHASTGWSTVVPQPAFGYHPTPAEPHQYTSTHRNRTASEDECNNIRNMLSNKKLSLSDIKLVQFIQLIICSLLCFTSYKII